MAAIITTHMMILNKRLGPDCHFSAMALIDYRLDIVSAYGVNSEKGLHSDTTLAVRSKVSYVLNDLLCSCICSS